MKTVKIDLILSPNYILTDRQLYVYMYICIYVWLLQTRKYPMALKYCHIRIFIYKNTDISAILPGPPRNVAQVKRGHSITQVGVLRCLMYSRY